MHKISKRTTDYILATANETKSRQTEEEDKVFLSKRRTRSKLPDYMQQLCGLAGIDLEGQGANQGRKKLMHVVTL